MDFAKLISAEYYVQWVEGLTILAILILLGYFFYVLNVFKKD
jgi:hypothetical protein